MRLLFAWLRLDLRGPWTRPPRLIRCPYCAREAASWAALVRCAEINHPSVPWTPANGARS